MSDQPAHDWALLEHLDAEEQLNQEWWSAQNSDEEWILSHGRTKLDMQKYAATEGTDLKAADFAGKNLKVIIESVEIRHYDARKDQPASDKAVLHFVGKEKTLVLNKTNTKRLIDSYGANSDSWLQQEIGLSTHETDLGTGWVVTPLNVQPPDFDDSIPF